MPSNFELTKYYNNPKCAECGQKISKYAIVKCDNCGSSVCSRHRPLRSLPWQCTQCRQRQKTFAQPINNNSSLIGQSPEHNPGITPLSYASQNDILARMAQAQDLFDDGLCSEANQIVEELLKEI